MTSPTPQPDEIKAIKQLTSELQDINQHRFVRIHNSRWRPFAYQFLSGLSFGLGSVLGATILVSLLAWWLSQFEFLPLIGDWASQLAREIQQTP
jgi:hypothetical protein